MVVVGFGGTCHFICLKAITLQKIESNSYGKIIAVDSGSRLKK